MADGLLEEDDPNAGLPTLSLTERGAREVMRLINAQATTSNSSFGKVAGDGFGRIDEVRFLEHWFDNEVDFDTLEAADRLGRAGYGQAEYDRIRDGDLALGRRVEKLLFGDGYEPGRRLPDGRPSPIADVGELPLEPMTNAHLDKHAMRGDKPLGN